GQNGVLVGADAVVPGYEVGVCGECSRVRLGAALAGGGVGDGVGEAVGAVVVGRRGVGEGAVGIDRHAAVARIGGLGEAERAARRRRVVDRHAIGENGVLAGAEAVVVAGQVGDRGDRDRDRLGGAVAGGRSEDSG